MFFDTVPSSKIQIPNIEGVSKSLDVIDEDEERLVERADHDRMLRNLSEFASIDDAYDDLNVSSGLTKKDVEILSKLFISLL
jgi:hypothetical protein